MNLKIKTVALELEIQNGDKAQIEKTLIGVFAHLNGESFIDAYTSLDVEERPVKSNRNFVEAVEGIKILNGIEHFQCAYKCMCGREGKRFVKHDATNTSCHGCNSLLNIVPANDGKPDKDFNYYVAY